MGYLEEDNSVREETGVSDDARVGSGQPRRPLRQVVARIREDFTEIVGLEAERVTGLRPTEEGWYAEVDVVELSRVPASTDVLATYEVTADVDGSVAAFECIRRFRRSEGGER